MKWLYRFRIQGWIAGYLLVRIGKLAAKKNDWHEFRHIQAAINVGNSENCGPNCIFHSTGKTETYLDHIALAKNEPARDNTTHREPLF